MGRYIELKAVAHGEYVGPLNLAVDLSCIASGAVLTQFDGKLVEKPDLYESVTFTELQSRYSQPKLAPCGIARF